MRKRDPLPLLPFLALLWAGWTGAGLEACLYCMAALVVLTLICDPFRLLSRWLSPQLRWGAALSICMALAALRLPGLALYSRVCALLVAIVSAELLVLKNGEWHKDWQVRQSPHVDKLLAHLSGGGSFEAADAWEGYGCREARALLHQTIGVECPEPLLESHYRPVYLLGYLHGADAKAPDAKRTAKRLEDAQTEVDRLTEELTRAQAEAEALGRHLHDIQADRDYLERSEKAWKDTAQRVQAQLEEAQTELETAREQLEALVPQQEPEPEVPGREVQDADILAYYEAMEHRSLAACAEHFGKARSTVRDAIARARAAQEGSITSC